MRGLLKAMAFVAAAVLVVWVISLINQPVRSEPVPTQSADTKPTVVSTTQPSTESVNLKETADVVLHWYFGSPDKSIAHPVDISRYAVPAFVDPIKDQWDGLQPGMSVTISQLNYPNAPRVQEDGTMTLVAHVETTTDYGESSKETDQITAILTFVNQDGKWLVGSLEEMGGYAGEDDMP